MPKTPRNVKQAEAIRAFVRAGGVQRRGRGGHQFVKMPNGATLSIPTGTLKVGLLETLVKRAGISMDEFLELL